MTEVVVRHPKWPRLDNHVSLGQLIAVLEVEAAHDADRVVPIGLSYPHSYRGHYAELAFEPLRRRPIAGMLVDATHCLHRHFTAYKGGEYLMYPSTGLWLASYGEEGEPIGPTLLRFMFGRLP